jgi:RNA polymerase sigma-70 factor, ECF subfamily
LKQLLTSTVLLLEKGGVLKLSGFQIDIEEIYNQFYRDVYHFAIYFTNNKNEAEDITQETFIKIMRNLPKLNDPSKLKVWILTIAKHTAIDYKRKQRAIPFLPEYFRNEKSTEQTPEEHAVSQDDWECIQGALLKIKPHYRSLIILRGLKEFSVQETAEILGCTELKVRVDYHRAIKQLKKEVGDLNERWGNINEGK